MGLRRGAMGFRLHCFNAANYSIDISGARPLTLIAYKARISCGG